MLNSFSSWYHKISKMSTQPIDGTELPPDLVAKPLALIGITGLDTINNAIHKTIWEAFGNNRRLSK